MKRSAQWLRLLGLLADCLLSWINQNACVWSSTNGRFCRFETYYFVLEAAWLFQPQVNDYLFLTPLSKMKYTLLRKYFLLVCATMSVSVGFAQTPTDGLMMAPRNICTALTYSRNSWDHYWEGTNFRSNSNLGTVSTQTFMLMGAYGISEKLNVIVGLPYIKTNASASYLSGESGFQDFSAWLKYRFIKQEIGFGILRTFVTGGFSVPTNNYNPDYLPLSLGLHSKTISGRLVVDYHTKPGIYLTAQVGYTRRSNIFIDRDSYLAGDEGNENIKLYYTNEVRVPDMMDANVHLGFRNGRFQTEVYLERMAGLSGDDIRYNDMPFPTNAMKATTVGFYGRYNIQQLGIIGGVNQVLNGRNVGKSSGFMVGVLYAFRVFGHGEKCGKPEGMEHTSQSTTTEQ